MAVVLIEKLQALGHPGVEAATHMFGDFLHQMTAIA